VVYASSCAVYGSLPGLPKAETDPLAPESPYAATKASNEAWASAYHRAGRVETVGLRYFNVFGPGQDPRGPYGAVIPRFVEAALEGRELEVHGDGQQGRDFVSVRDVARANIAAATAAQVEARVFNVGSGGMITILDLARVVGEVVGRPPSVRHLPAREGDVRFSRADISAAAAELGWSPREDFGAALRETVRSFMTGA
jgi:nucleoside-diphosphate-sugar epimerase